MRPNIVSLTSILLMLSSCGTFREFHPDIPETEKIIGSELAVPDTSSFVKLEWKDYFNDPILQALIDTALVRNTDYRIAQLRTEQAHAALSEARLAFFPSLGLGAEGNVTGYNGMTSATYDIGLKTSWEIDIFGKLKAAKQGTAAAAVSAREEAQAVRTQLIATVANLYYSLLMLDRQLEIARSTLKNWLETVRVMEALKKAGMAREPGILQTEANIVALRSDIVSMERNIKEVENSLCSILAQPPCIIKRGLLENSELANVLLDRIPVKELSNRPDVRVAEMELARTHYAMGEARASFYPSLTLEGTLGFSNNGGMIVNPGQWLLNAIGQLIQPIFDRGRLKATYKIAQKDREIALLRFNQTLLDAGKEVNDALADIKAARQRLSLTREQIRMLGDAVHKTELLMLHSPVNYLEVLTAQQALLTARQLEVQCIFDEIAGQISLFHSLGGGKML